MPSGSTCSILLSEKQTNRQLLEPKTTNISFDQSSYGAKYRHNCLSQERWLQCNKAFQIRPLCRQIQRICSRKDWHDFKFCPNLSTSLIVQGLRMPEARDTNTPPPICCSFRIREHSQLANTGNGLDHLSTDGLFCGTAMHLISE